MFDLIYRFDPNRREESDHPTSADAAVRFLEEGNHHFAHMLDDHDSSSGKTAQRVISVDANDLGLPAPDGGPPTQKPFAAVLGCSDARVPVEMIFGQTCNSMFVVRVAGNVLGAECLGSLEYSLAALGESLKVVLVLGHSRCGAVTAAVDAFIDPAKYLQLATSQSLRSVVDRIFPAARAAHWALEQVHGPEVKDRERYRAALIETTVVLNAALTASALQNEFRDRLGSDRRVVYGVYNLVTRQVKVVMRKERDEAVLLSPAPDSAEGIDRLAVEVAGSTLVREILG